MASPPDSARGAPQPPAWFTPRGYRHFDAPVGGTYAERSTKKGFSASHSWSPLISYVKEERRYKKLIAKTVKKKRVLMYASHRDACILSYYSSLMTKLIDDRYINGGITENIIAYRSLGKSNYDFAAEVVKFARDNSPCVVLCFDITGFFDNLDHGTVKTELLRLLRSSRLSDDWYAIYKFMTKYRHIPLEDLKNDPAISLRKRSNPYEPIATISDVKNTGIQISQNRSKCGIPQGTPISAAVSNMYMWSLDVGLSQALANCNGMYRRYSDDILLICPPKYEAEIVKNLSSILSSLGLILQSEKTERTEFCSGSTDWFQYLGFHLSHTGAVIRPGSLARQWRRARRAIRRTEAAGAAGIASGKSAKTFTKKLRRKFTADGVRNFSSYARRSSKSLKSKGIVRQARRLERMVDQAIKNMP